MNIKDTEKLIELMNSIMDLYENIPYKDPTGYNNFLWHMASDMLIKPIMIMQNILYQHLETLVEKEHAHSGTNQNNN